MKFSLTDELALERTKLANERTFLAYFRSSVVFLSSGLAILKLSMFEEIKWLGVSLVILGPILIIIGIVRLVYVKRKLKKLRERFSDKS
ncbi:MAG: DUF202 domain-containing protein [Nonlabens sp.]